MRAGLAGIVAAITILFHAATAWAQDVDTPSLRFNGFGTAGVVHSSETDADFVSNIFLPEGAGHSNRWSAKVDSRLGLQATADVTPRLSGVVQLITEQRYDGTYKPTVEWANISFDVTPELTVRAGRIIQPTFMVSEYRKVGYATPWVRPPQEIYHLIPVTNIDGADFAIESRAGGFTHTLRGAYGGADARTAPDGDEVSSRDALIITNTLEYGATTLFGAYSTFRLSMDALDPLFDGFRAFGPEGEDIADRYDVDGKRFEMVNVGARYDPGGWFVMGEWVHMESRTFIGDNRAWYVTGGYRYGPVTPYVTFARVRAIGATSDPGLDAPQAQGLNAALNELLGAAAEQRSVSVGARWDFTRNAALTVQYDHLDLDDDSSGVLVNEQPDFSRGGTVSLFSATLDFVF